VKPFTLSLKLSLPLVLSLSACSGAVDTIGSTSTSAITLAPADAARLLDFVNYPGTDLTVLDEQIGLDARAAKNIIAHRDGSDAVAPSGDDQLFASIADLDAVSYIGDSALAKLQSWSAAHRAPAAETEESVAFAGWQVESVVFGANHAAQSELDSFLDARAANGLVAGRPFASLAQVAAVPYVGATALGKLRDHAIVWWPAAHGAPAPSGNGLGGSFDGVSFDDATAQVALEIANQATYNDLVLHGLPATGAAPIVGNRPYTTVAQVSAVSGVGPATMTALKGYAQSGQWGAPPPQGCVGSFDDAVGPHLADLLLVSESDRPFDLVSFPGAASTSPPTAASFFKLLNKPSNWSYESRDPSGYYRAFEPANASADPNAASLVQAAIAAQLTSVIYVAVHKPASDPYHAEVDVYLIGRTACGDLVGLHAIAVET
jgi:DNA uptake protein ComE-like DNA-binding protein